jgi:hypothetical protein
MIAPDILARVDGATHVVSAACVAMLDNTAAYRAEPRLVETSQNAAHLQRC